MDDRPAVVIALIGVALAVALWILQELYRPMYPGLQ